jgi:AmpD protein
VSASTGLAWADDPEGWVAGAHRLDSPHHDERPAEAVIELLVIHHISLPPGRFSGDAIARLFTGTLDTSAHPFFAQLAGLRVSAHFLIRRRGELLQFVATARRAWHAGVSRFAGRERCNDFSIGVELEGDGEHPFTAAQYRRLTQLTRLLAARHPLRWLAGHSDIAPGRKQDPGPFFEWPRFEASVREAGLRRNG